MPWKKGQSGKPKGVGVGKEKLMRQALMMELKSAGEDLPELRNTYLSVSCYHLGLGESVVSEVTIYHSPNCGTSRNVLGLIRNAGIEPAVIE